MDTDALRIVNKIAVALGRDARGGGERFARAFDPDVDLVTCRGERLRGRTAVARAHALLASAGSARLAAGAPAPTAGAAAGADSSMAAVSASGGLEVLGARTLGPGVVVGHLLRGGDPHGAVPGDAAVSLVTLVLVRQAMDWRIAAYHESAAVAP